MSDLRLLDTKRTRSSSWWWIIGAAIIVLIIIVAVIYFCGSSSTTNLNSVGALHQMTKGAVSSFAYPTDVEYIDSATGRNVSPAQVENGEYAPI